ncbi:MAG TPA: protein kinase [Thermoanaerobaculia bacterium]|nr:protein kinase [Thermoanaerobaculia bacterium]
MTLNTKSCSGCGTLITAASSNCPTCGTVQKPSSTLVPGTTFDGKYEVENLLGQGGMGEVYKVRHAILGAYRCIKVMKKSLLIDEGFKGRFLREAVLATKIHHQNVALVYDFSTLADGTCYMVSEFIDGTTLRKWVSTNGPFSPSAAVEVMLQVLDGLDQIHRRGLLHRDISSENVMVTSDSDDRLLAKIIDLGIAKQVGGSAMAGEGTQVGMFVGNPKYASPEQFGFLRDGETVDARADLYCLGVVIYEMVTGQPPFRSQTPQGYAMKHLQDQPPPLSQAAPNVAWPAGFEACIFKALEKEREDRYSSARDFHTALLHFRKWSSPPHVGSLVAAIGGPAGAAAPAAAPVRSASSFEMDADAAFSRAASIDTSEAYRAFLAGYGGSSLSEEARAALEERVAFEAAAGEDTEAAWQRYVTKWQGDTHAAVAKNLMARARKREEDAWVRAESEGTANALNSFVARYPNAHVAETARHLLQEIQDFERATSGGRGTLEQVLRRYPNSRFAAEAKTRLQAIVQEEKFAEAARQNSVTAWRIFLSEFPDSPRAGNARVKMAELEAIDYRELLKTGDIQRLDSFLTRFPETAKRGELLTLRSDWADKQMFKMALVALEKNNFAEAETLAKRLASSSQRADLNARIQSAADAVAWTRAERENTRDAYELYLEDHPAGSGAAIARQRIDQASRTLLEQARKEEEARAAAARARREEEAAARARREEDARLAAAQARREEEARFAAAQARREEEARIAAAQARREQEERAAARRIEQQARADDEAAAEATRSDIHLLRTVTDQRMQADEPPTIVTPAPFVIGQTQAAPMQRPAVSVDLPSPIGGFVPAPVPYPVDAPVPPASFAASRTNRKILFAAAATLLVAAILMKTFIGHIGDKQPPMKLRLDSVPWAEISSIKGDDGKEYVTAPPAYTPIAIDLPPGHYQVVFRRENKSLTKSVDLRGPQQVVSAGFETMNPSDYFKEAGW